VRLLPLPGVFKPHSDSWLLARHLANEPLTGQSRVLDLCTGSGVLAVGAAARAQVVAVDVSRRAVLAARLNARLNGVNLTAVRGSLFEPIGSARFDVIVSNPPYLPTPDPELPRRGLARAWEAGLRGRTHIDPICTQAPDHLEPGGVLLLIHSSVCGERETLAVLTEHGLQASVVDRSWGPLGPRLRDRQDWLKERGLLPEDGREEMLVIRAQRPSAITAGDLPRSGAGNASSAPEARTADALRFQ
jgi:release factor glutamine methyltransferase